MKNKSIFFVRLLFYMILFIWIMIYFLDVLNKPFNVFTSGVILFFLLVIIEAFFPKLISISRKKWEDYTLIVLFCFATIYNIFYWNDIILSPPKGFRPFIYDFFNLLKNI